MPPKKRARRAVKKPTMTRTATAAEANMQPADFEECMGVQNLVAGPREKWEQQMEKRMDDSETFKRNASDVCRDLWGRPHQQQRA